MKRRPIIYLAAALLVFAGLFGSARYLFLAPGGETDEKRSLRIVRIDGVEACHNVSLCCVAWGGTRVADRPACVLARDGDLLMASTAGEEGDEDHELVFPYLQGDGTSLSMEFRDSRLLMGGKTVSLSLLEDGRGWGWLEKATAEELARLRMLEILHEVEPSRLPILKRLAQANAGVGLQLGDQKTLRRVLPLFHPRWLILTGAIAPEEEDLATISSRQGLESLWIDASDSESLAFLARLPGLRSLGLEDWDPEKTGPLPAGCQDLESLTISESEIEDLFPIEHLTRLRDLQLFMCGLTDISGLSKLPGLKSLTLSLREEVSDLGPLKELRGLTRLGLMGGIEGDGLAPFVAAHPRLRTLELVSLEKNVSVNLGPLATLSELEHLVLLCPGADYSPLFGLKKLRFLVLPKEVFEESPEDVRKLEAALPHCTVAAGEGVCLGSGWILALLPVVALARAFAAPKPTLG